MRGTTRLLTLADARCRISCCLGVTSPARPSRIICIWARTEFNGLRISWETMDTNSDWISFRRFNVVMSCSTVMVPTLRPARST